MSTSTDQGARYTTLYMPGYGGVCGEHPEWYGLVCTTSTSGSATPPAVGSPVPTTTYTYNENLQPETLSESVNGVTERTVNYAYDLSGRPTDTSTVDNSATGSVAVDDVEPVYSSTTGLQTATDYVTGDVISNGTMTSGGTAASSTATAYDANGRVSVLT